MCLSTASTTWTSAPDSALAEAVRHQLLHEGRCGLGTIIEALKIAPRLQLDVLATAALVYDVTLASYWQDDWVSARIHHAIRLTDQEFALATAAREGQGPTA